MSHSYSCDMQPAQRWLPGLGPVWSRPAGGQKASTKLDLYDRLSAGCSIIHEKRPVHSGGCSLRTSGKVAATATSISCNGASDQTRLKYLHSGQLVLKKIGWHSPTKAMVGKNGPGSVSRTAQSVKNTGICAENKGS